MDRIKGINQILFDDVKCHFGTYGVSQDAQAEIYKFLCTSPENYLKRQQYAKEAIKLILHSHGKAELSEEIATLGEIEERLIPIQYQLRDHVIHTLFTFLLGIYLIDKLELKDKITSFEWKLTSLLHDIAYPYEIAFYLTQKIETHINNMASKLQISIPILKASNTVINLEKLTRSPSSIRLLTKIFIKWGFNFRAGLLYRKMKSEHNIDHGIICSMLVLKAMDILYSYYNSDRIRGYTPKDNNDWNYENFENQIVNSCASIFIHNLPIELFDTKKIDMIMHPLPFVLRLSDELQDWERITTKDNSYLSGELYSISIMDGTITFCVPPHRLDKIKRSLACFNSQRIIVDTKIVNNTINTGHRSAD